MASKPSLVTGMSESASAPAASRGGAEPTGYTVVARRYRPQRFEEVVGQDHVVQSLRNAIRLNRVTHAYVFCGTRGVGKTSIARIFAKCLNCEQGPTETPCNVCDICQAIAVGQDVDVIEIDGASNNGVEAVRELRQNASLRPSRARYKIYYIDEVHMLSTGAFNALLKTLEEPPEHVKFFFATTEVSKIPITVLSRCQRYDFAPIGPDRIVRSLTTICEREGVPSEPEALQIVARRAAGSMRDAQSLLEQLLAVGAAGLTTERVHALLGTAQDDQVLELIEALAGRDAGGALRLLDQAVNQGIQASEVLHAALELLRDVMVLAAGADVPALAAAPRHLPRLRELANRWSLDTVLAAIQILSEARSRLRGSAHGRLIVELGLARVARLENFSEISELLAKLASAGAGATKATGTGTGTGTGTVSGGTAGSPRSTTAAPLATAPVQPASTSQKKKSTQADETTESAGLEATNPPPPSLEEILDLWPKISEDMGLKLGAELSRLKPTAIFGPNLLVIELEPGYNWLSTNCESPEHRLKIEAVLSHRLKQRMEVRFSRRVVESREGEVLADSEPGGSASSRSPGEGVATSPAPTSAIAPEKDPWVQRIVELFDARRVHVDHSDPSRE